MGLTTLEAINIMMRAAGEPPVTSQQPGQATPAGYADDILNRERMLLLEARDFGQVWEHDYTLEVPTVKIAVSGTTGTFTYDETVTESVSGATGKFRLLDTDPATDLLYLYGVSGTFTGGQTLTGGSSGATTTGSTYTAITEGPIGVDRVNWLDVIPYHDRGYRVESVRFTKREDRLYDLDDNTETFDADVRVSIMRYLTLVECHGPLRHLIALRAAQKFTRYIKRGQIDDAFMRDEIEQAETDVFRFEQKLKSERANMLLTPDAQAVHGGRKTRSPINIFSLRGG
jgi:hypothetical protein